MHVPHQAPGTRYAFLFFLFSSSGGWVKIKLELPHFHVCIRYMSCFDSTHAPVATAARAAAPGLVSMSTRPDIPGMLHLEREARDWSTYNEYSYRLILLLLLYVYCSRAHPHFPSQFRRRRLQDFLTSSANTPKSWWEGNLFFLAEGKQIFRNVLSQTLY